MLRSTLLVITTFAALVIVGIRADARNRQLPQE